MGRAGSVGGETAVAAGTTATGTAVAPSSSVADLRGPGLPPRIGERDRETDRPTNLHAPSASGRKTAAHGRHGAMREMLAAEDWAASRAPPEMSSRRLGGRELGFPRVGRRRSAQTVDDRTLRTRTCAWRLAAAAFNKLTDRVFWVRSPAATRNAAAGWGGIPGFPKHAEKKAVHYLGCGPSGAVPAAKYSHAV